jgi:hypothetical protein
MTVTRTVEVRPRSEHSAVRSRTAIRRTHIEAETETVRPTPRTQETSSALPRIVTVYRGPEGDIYHARCHTPVGFIGTRGGIEYDFYCLECREHVTLTENALTRIPQGSGLPEA